MRLLLLAFRPDDLNPVAAAGTVSELLHKNRRLFLETEELHVCACLHDVTKHCATAFHAPACGACPHLSELRKLGKFVGRLESSTGRFRHVKA